MFKPSDTRRMQHALNTQSSILCPLFASLLIVAGPGCREKSKAIENVLKTEQQYSGKLKMTLQAEDFSSEKGRKAILDATEEYISLCKKQELTNCPPEFTSAYWEYVVARANIGKVIANCPVSEPSLLKKIGVSLLGSVTGFTVGVIGKSVIDLLGSSSEEKTIQWVKTFDAANKSVESSWNKVVEAARKEGAGLG